MGDKYHSDDAIDNSPQDGELTRAVSSNWAYDHAADLDAHIRSFMRELRTGGYWFRPFPSQTGAAAAVSINQMHAMPFIVPRNLTVDRLGFRVVGATADYTTGTATFTNGSDQVVGAGGASFAAAHVGRKIQLDADAVWHTISAVADATHLTLTANYSDTGGAGAYTIRATARLGIYKNGTNMYPGDLVVDAGLVEVHAAAGVEAVIDQALTKGLYWIAFASNGTPSVYQATPVYPVLGGGVSNLAPGILGIGYHQGSKGTGALADPYGGGLSPGYYGNKFICWRLKSLD